MTKIIHASDFCLGRQFSGIGKSGDFVRKALKDSLERCVTEALDRSIDLFLVSGNLFATNMVSRHLVEFMFQQVERLGRIPFVVLPGFKDDFDDNSIYRYMPSENRPENFHILQGRHCPCLDFSDSGITVYGLSIPRHAAELGHISLPTKENTAGVHIVVVSNFETPDSSESDISMRQISDSLIEAGFDYVAIGGGNYRKWNPRSYSAGSPEAQGFDQNELGKVLLVDLDPGRCSVDDIETGQLRWKQIELDNTHFRYTIELEEEVLKHASPNTLLQVRFDGGFVTDGYLDLSELESNLKDSFCCLRVEDDRLFTSAQPSTGGNGGDTLLTDYNFLLEEAIEKATPELRPTYFQALVTGTAMLSGKDVIS